LIQRPFGEVTWVTGPVGEPKTFVLRRAIVIWFPNRSRIALSGASSPKT
jgi:hypothetical protein